MSARTSAALLAISLGLTGCDALCEFGFGDSCRVCKPVSVPEAWDDPLLQPLMPGKDALICEADGDETGAATLSYWVPERVHETNVTVVGAAQQAGWARLEDNWFEDDDTSQMAKWSRLGLARGDRMRIDVKAERKGARVEIDVEGVPPPPSLRGDVTVFAYRKATFALFDGRMALLPGVSSGVSIPMGDGFIFRAGPGRFERYQSDGTVVKFAAFPASGPGALEAHGAGPRGLPWMSHNPEDPARPLLLGEFIGDAWDVQMVPDLHPPLPNGPIDAAFSDDGTIWLLAGDVLYAKEPGGSWHGTRLDADSGPLRPLMPEGDGALISTENAVLRATLEEGRFRVCVAAELQHYAELRGAGPLGVVARTNDEVVLIRGEETTPTELPGESRAPDIATNALGVIAVATKSPTTLLVRGGSGSIVRYPREGEIPGHVYALSIDPMGRVWTLMVDGDPFVADDGELVPLEGLVDADLHPISITFLGSGAPPFLDVRAPDKTAFAG